jgi:broad specificity phosphatase PhoE
MALRVYFIRHGESQNNALAKSLGASDHGDGDSYYKMRSPDPALTDLGEKQANCVANLFGDSELRHGLCSLVHDTDLRVSAVYCSAMHRALQTATPIARGVGLPLTVWSSIFEVGGCFVLDPLGSGKNVGCPGLTLEAAQSKFGPFKVKKSTDRSQLTSDGWWSKTWGKETNEEAVQRACCILDDLRSLAAKCTTLTEVAFVSHKDILNILFEQLIVGHGTNTKLSTSGLAVQNYGLVDIRFSNCSLSCVEFLPGGFSKIHAMNIPCTLAGSRLATLVASKVTAAKEHDSDQAE